ncbi:MAG TPA: hypothetical protein VF503_07095 [Sphingobium sp.]|uniref:hypothetical protein n=1 Tax=Sphingobium sp. TaxID=1912891 RepID=UPI002ED602CE
MKNLIGTAVGAAIDRKDGDSGIKGAAAGYAVSGLIKFTAKLATVAAIGWGAIALARRARDA